jgi:hypothetical protein
LEGGPHGAAGTLLITCYNSTCYEITLTPTWLRWCSRCARWLTREFLDHRAAVGSGEGFYLARDEAAADDATPVLGLITMVLSYRFNERWSTRLYGYRTIITDGRDSDVVLWGWALRWDQ